LAWQPIAIRVRPAYPGWGSHSLAPWKQTHGFAEAGKTLNAQVRIQPLQTIFRASRSSPAECCTYQL